MYWPSIILTIMGGLRGIKGEAGPPPPAAKEGGDINNRKISDKNFIK